MPIESAARDIFTEPMTCLAGLAVNDPVYISAANTATKADGSDATKMPAIGLVFSKPTTTTCIVQLFGEFNGLTGLTAGADYYVGASGTLTASTAGLVTLQKIGKARSTTVLTLAPMTVYPVVRPELMDLRNGDGTVMDATGAASKFRIVATPGTSLVVQTEAAQNNTKTDVALFEVQVPDGYARGANLTLTTNVQRVVASGTTLTTSFDVEAWKLADDGTGTSDICATAVQAYTNTAAADLTWTLTGTTLTPGDRLLVRITGVATEGGNAGTVRGQLNSVRLQ